MVLCDTPDAVSILQLILRRILYPTTLSTTLSLWLAEAMHWFLIAGLIN